MKKYKAMLAQILKPYSAILFLDNKVAGVLILLITFLNPSVALSGLVAVLCTVLFAKLIDVKEAYLEYGFYIYNSLLVGMGIGYIFSISMKSMMLIATASAFTFMFSFMLNRLFSVYKIPILSFPFSIVTMFVYLASLKYSTLYTTLVNHATMYDITLPLIFSAYLKSIGTIFFLPNNLAGLLLLIVMLYFSRIIVIMATVGFYFGVLTHSFFLGSFEQALYDPYAFNYILVGVALCGIFLLPTLKNFIISLIAISISVLLTDAIGTLFHYYSIPVFTLPFNLTVTTVIFMLSIIYYKEFNYNIKSTPEASLSYYLSTIFRFGVIPTKISLPFSGTWTVYQGFDGEWTHKGKFAYAYDFVKYNKGKSYKGEGLHVDDYYCFGESILSPVDGYVVDVRHDLVDNYIGSVDRVNNWGNYIIIRSNSGFYVEISHLMQYSLMVNIGDYVSINTLLAKCGNSGYSPEPHIHIQVQDIGVLGAETKEFIFSEYHQGSDLIFNTIPGLGESVSSVIIDKSIQSKFLFILEEKFTYDIFVHDKYIDSYTFTVKMNALGEFYFEDYDSNKLYFTTTATQFYFYQYEGEESHLKWLFILSPRVPFISKDFMKYNDFLPINLMKNPMQVLVIELLSSIRQNVAKLEQTYTYTIKRIESEYGHVRLADNQKCFKEIQYADVMLKRAG